MSIQHYITQILNGLEGRGRIRRPLVWCVQIGIFLFSGLAAFFLRFDFTVPAREVPHLVVALPVWMGIKAAIFRREKLDSGWWGFISIFDVAHLAIVNFAASLLGAIPILMVEGSSFPRSVYALDLLLCFVATAGVRIAFRILTEAAAGGSRGASAKRVIIYGAGQAGVMLLRETRSGAKNLYQVCGFVDDDPGKRQDSIQGLPVWGMGSQLPRLVQKHKIEKILIAVPSATGPQMTEILKNCSQARVPYKTIPSLTEVMQGQGIASSIRKVEVEDLLGRSPVHLDERQIRGKVRDRVVLVTGAGGSIGSELCRQLARFSPKAIVGYDNSENALFHLDLEMRERFADVCFCPEIGSTQNPGRLSEVLSKHSVSLLYHAAAYKHVPLLEAHVVEAVENNVLATANIARLAEQHGLEDVVMISTDKAVRPTSMLGATKRVAELVVNSFNGPSTKYVSVRFGNVLGSNGSVIPLFKKQIAAGGPVTVTHPEMHRYFMTIPEAAQLVLQASAMGRGGEIFVLDMGQPMKILDLARNLIILSGLRPDEDIKISFSGLRPGEKLYEELSSFDESTAPTEHQKIKIFRGPGVAREQMSQNLHLLAELCAKRDISRLILALKDIVPEYNPSVHLLRQALETRSSTSSLAALATAVGSSPQAAHLKPGAYDRLLTPAYSRVNET
jgi:FlaA1/EpsC-like NDP-sugar epimerase